MQNLRIFCFAVLASLFLLSCAKEKAGLIMDPAVEAIKEPASFLLAESGFGINEVQDLGGLQNDLYTEGRLEYTKNGITVVTVDFGAGTAAEKAKVVQDGTEYLIDLEKNDDKVKIKKRIVVPLVKAEDCGFEIISGMIKFYDWETGMWVATVDFGDGTCDDLATKVTMEGIVTFAVSDYF